MFAIGAIYLVFEEKISGPAHTPNGAADAQTNFKSRIVLGIQVRHTPISPCSLLSIVQLGLVLLSIIVTKSSIHYVQARQGLPLGVLAVGWSTLGEPLVLTLLAAANVSQWGLCSSRTSTACIPTAITSTAWW